MCALLVAPATSAGADGDPVDGPLYRRIRFPVQGTVTYWDDFGVCRDGCSRTHQGNDLMGTRLMPLVAAASGTVSYLKVDSPTTRSGNMVTIRDSAGWTYSYMHVNNDTPGTDDGANPAQWRFGPGITLGATVTAGQLVGYMGDSGNAEGTSPHLHFEIAKPDGTEISPYTSLRLAQGLPAYNRCRYDSNPKRTPSSAGGTGYWVLAANGNVYPFGTAVLYGATRNATTGGPVGLASTPTGEGYWIVDARGNVSTYGDASFYGSTADLALDRPIFSLTPTPTGKGYWLLASDGGVFSFGDAKFHGSTGGMRLNAPVVGMARTADGGGYWLVARDGGVFSFGDAAFHGSTGNLRLDEPVNSMVPSATGAGYLLLADDGGTFAFGDVVFRGSLPGIGLCAWSDGVAVVPTNTGNGYWIAQADGRLRAFGDARHFGDLAASALRPVSIAVVPTAP
ncbi:MAG TPA: M23 family metallopeptidase [Acidimicrobiia bacterium]|nr:M23 family metallopeptidase [Acidimicrobiia bacterium]